MVNSTSGTACQRHWQERPSSPGPTTNVLRVDRRTGATLPSSPMRPGTVLAPSPPASPRAPTEGRAHAFFPRGGMTGASCHCANDAATPPRRETDENPRREQVRAEEKRTCLQKQTVAVVVTGIDKNTVLISIDKNTGQTARIRAVAHTLGSVPESSPRPWSRTVPRSSSA